MTNDELKEATFEALLAEAIERARFIRDDAFAAGGGKVEARSAALTVTHLETAALWHCNYRAQLDLGEAALLDWLLET